MNDKTCQNCKNHFYKNILKCASCYELSNFELRDEKENVNAEVIHSK